MVGKTIFYSFSFVCFCRAPMTWTSVKCFLKVKCVMLRHQQHFCFVVPGKSNFSHWSLKKQKQSLNFKIFLNFSLHPFSFQFSLCPKPIFFNASFSSSCTCSLSAFSFKEDVKSLTAHIVENYWKALEDVDYVQTFKGLKLRYEQQRERQDNPKLDRWEGKDPVLMLHDIAKSKMCVLIHVLC